MDFLQKVKQEELGVDTLGHSAPSELGNALGFSQGRFPGQQAAVLLHAQKLPRAGQFWLPNGELWQGGAQAEKVGRRCHCKGLACFRFLI